MQCLYQARDRIEAQFLRDYLDRHHISAVIFGDYLSGAAGELPANIWPSIWVLADGDLPRAQVLLERFLAEAGEAKGGAWVCRTCGEQVEAGFELCWNCGCPKA